MRDAELYRARGRLSAMAQTRTRFVSPTGIHHRHINVCLLLIQLQRIYRSAINSHLEVKMRSRRVAGSAHTRDDLSLLNLFPGTYQVGGVMAVYGQHVVTVVDKYHLSIATVVAREYYDSTIRRHYGSPRWSSDIDALMKIPSS